MGKLCTRVTFSSFSQATTPGLGIYWHSWLGTCYPSLQARVDICIYNLNASLYVVRIKD